MPKKLNVKTILRKNKQVDRNLLADSARLAKKLHRFGQTGPVRQLASPFERKQATTMPTSQIQL
jgi:hypothetical protein